MNDVTFLDEILNIFFFHIWRVTAVSVGNGLFHFCFVMNTLLIFKKRWAFQISLWQPGLSAKLWRQPFHYLVQPGKLDNSSCANKIRTTFIFSDINNTLFSPLQTNYYSVYTSILLAPIYLLIMVPEQQNNTVWDKIKASIDTKLKSEVWKVWKSLPLK